MSEELKRLWSQCGGLDRLADDFVSEMAHFLEHCPKLITDSSKKIETEESEQYAEVEKHCKKLDKKLGRKRPSFKNPKGCALNMMCPFCDKIPILQCISHLSLLIVGMPKFVEISMFLATKPHYIILRAHPPKSSIALR